MLNFQHSYALVIGINSYSHGISSLKTAVSDATEIAHILESKYGYTVALLVDNAATLSQIRQVLETELPNQIQKGDRFLFYFAGHGIALNGEDGPEGYLVPQDAKSGSISTYLRMSEVNKALLQLPCRHFLGILDCCFAGAFRWSSTRQAIPLELLTLHKERYDRFIQDPAWQVITSAAYDQTALDAFDLKDDRGQTGVHSPFANALIAALEGKADAFPPAEANKPAGDGVITASELYLYLREQVEIATEVRAIRQTPGIYPMNKHDKGEYIFLTPGHALNLPPAPPLDVSKNPYRGLLSFGEEHSDLFFGRSALTQKLYEFVTSSTLTVVLGASGSGKSSLVKAGLIPKMRQFKDSNTWFILPPFRPGESPFKALNNALASVNQPAIAPDHEASSLGLLTPGESLGHWFTEHPQGKLLLVVDQFEELITLCQNDSERQQFLAALAVAIATYPNQLHVVLTLRSDFEPQFGNTVLEKDWQTARFIVPAMKREELREAIEAPASARVMYFDPHELVDQLIDEVANMPGALPLLSFALSELYLKYLKRQEDAKNRGETIDRAITQADYQELGGVTRSLTQRADQEYEELVKQDIAYAQTIRNVMLRMVAVGGELARRRVPMSELEYPEPENTRVKTVIQHFSVARLLTHGIDSEAQPYVEPAHDALVRGWQKLLEWKQEYQENLFLQRRLTSAVEEWNQQFQEPASFFEKRFEQLVNWLDKRISYTAQLLQAWSKNQVKQKIVNKSQFLWNTDPHLDILQQILNSKDIWFNKIEFNFIKLSILRKKMLKYKNNSIIAIVILLLLGLTITALLNLFISEKRRLNAELETLSLSSEKLFLADQELDALLIALRAGKQLQDKTNWVNESTKIKVISSLNHSVYGVREQNRWIGHDQAINSISVNSKTDILASASDDGTIKIWNDEGRKLEVIHGHDDRVWAVKFSPDGQMLASASEDKSIKLWNLQGQLIKTLLGHIDAVEDVSFSPKNDILASTSRDGTIIIWTSSGKIISTFKLGKYNVENIDFSPDGSKIVTVVDHDTIKLLDLNGKELLSFKTDAGVITDISFSPDGKIIASTGNDGNVRLSGLDGKTIGVLKQDFQTDSVSFSPDGKTLISATGDGVITLWDLKTKKDLFTLKGHTGSINSISFSRDGQTIVSVSDDGIIKLWSVSPKELTRLKEHTKSIKSIKFSSDGQTLASAGDDGTIKLWKLDDLTVTTVGEHSNYPVNSISFSPNGKVIASASNDGTVKLWNITGKEINTFKGHDSAVMSVDFNKDGTTLASASQDFTNNIKIWDILNPKQPFSFSGHTNSVVDSVRFSPDSSMLASASTWDNTIKLWKLNGELINTLKGHKDGVTSITFSPNGKILASGSYDNTVKLWNLKGQEINTFRGHTNYVSDVNFSPDGKIIASSSWDNTVKLWSLDGEEITTLKGQDNSDVAHQVYTVSFSPDGRTLASNDGTNGMILWNLDLQKLLIQGCSWVNSYLNNPNALLSDEDRHLCKDDPL